MRVSILPGCIACRFCETTCSDVFTVFDEAEVNADAVAGREALCREAAAGCPVQVIAVDEG